jgi:hypothetical protein
MKVAGDDNQKRMIAPIIIIVAPRFFSPLMKNAIAPTIRPQPGRRMEIAMSKPVAFRYCFRPSGLVTYSVPSFRSLASGDRPFAQGEHLLVPQA